VTALRLAGFVGIDGALLAVPMLTACLFAVRLRVRNPVLLTGCALCGLAIHGSVVFWAFYSFDDRGRWIGVVLAVLEIGAITALLFAHGLALARPLATLALPAVATFFVTLFVLSFGLVRGGTEVPVQAASNRFVPGLPVDNAVPLILARAVESDVRPLPDPLYANWSSSDRPPLQSGIYLSATSLVDPEESELQYTVVGAFLQSLWVLGLWAFFISTRTPTALAAVTTAAVLFSGFTLLNTFYVWPKLLSAAYLLIVAAVFLAQDSRALLAERGSALVVGLAIGGALLAHTGAIIPLLALALSVLIRRRVLPWRFVVPAVLAAAVVVAPWTAYQKFVNPPGDKLLKLQVAGIPNIETERSLLREISDHYGQVGLQGAVENKLNNFAEPFRGADSIVRDVWRIVRSDVSGGDTDRGVRDRALHDLRFNQTFRLFPAMGLMAIGPILLAFVLAYGLGAGRLTRGSPTGLEWSLLLFLALTIVLWSLVLFGPNYTVIHQGSYVTPVLAFVLCTAACWKLSPHGTVGLVALQSAAVLYLYKDIPPEGSPPSLFTGTGSSMAVLTVLALAAILTLLAATSSPTLPLRWWRPATWISRGTEQESG
jgi:hypothetical protein